MDKKYKKQDKIQNTALFYNKRKLFGLPIEAFVFITGMTIITLITLTVYLPLYIGVPLDIIFIVITYIPAYLIHVDDPLGYRTWISVLILPESYHNDFPKRKSIKIVNLDTENIQYLTLTKIFKRNKT